MLEQVRADTPFELEETDITGDPELERRYRERIPVVEVDGVEAFTYFVHPDGLRRRLGAQSRQSRGFVSAQFLLRHGKHGRYARLQVVSKLPIPLEGVEEARNGDRLTVGVAARLSQYLRVLTQARKMGKERISSQEISEYTNINATQIRRDLSGFGKFGKRGVGYNIDALAGEIRKILRTQGQHNIALFGAGRLGQAIANSTIFADHGFNIAAAFDADPRRSASRSDRRSRCSTTTASRRSSARRTSSSRCSRSRTTRPRGSPTDVVEAGVKIIFNYTRGAPRRSLGRDRAHDEPGRRAALRALLLPDLASLSAGGPGASRAGRERAPDRGRAVRVPSERPPRSHPGRSPCR